MSVDEGAVRLFRDRFGGEPDGLWQAPGRVNLIGEHTDYNDGYVLPFAIDRSTAAALAVRDDGRIRVASTFDDQVVDLPMADVAARRFAGWSAYPLGVAWAFGEAGTDLTSVPGFDLALDSDVPVGAGLSSSAAIEMATAVALNDVWSVGADRATLARLGRRAENIAVGAPTGIMDQSASVFGKADSAVFLDCRTLQVERVRLGFADAGLVLLVVDTRVEHAHATGGYKDRREACERGAATLGVPALRDVALGDLDRAGELLDPTTFRRVRHIVTEDDRVLRSVAALKSGDLSAFGALMYESHASMRDDFEISVPELDTVVEVAAERGVIGARMTGGGFGGAAIALVETERVDDLSLAVREAFAGRGYREPVAFAVVPADGARRIR
jgi:galactokinase